MLHIRVVDLEGREPIRYGHRLSTELVHQGVDGDGLLVGVVNELVEDVRGDIVSGSGLVPRVQGRDILMYAAKFSDQLLAQVLELAVRIGA